MNIQKNQISLLNYLRAVAPLVYIVDNDEANTIKFIRNACLSLFIKLSGRKQNPSAMENLKYFEYTVTEGLQPSTVKDFSEAAYPELVWDNVLENTENGTPKKENKILFLNRDRPKQEVDKTTDINQALISFMEIPFSKKQENIHILVIKDVHNVLKQDGLAVRKIKDIVISAANSEYVTRHIIILNPIKDIPVELANIVNIIEWKLPDSQDIENYLIRRMNLTVISEESEWRKALETYKISMADKYSPDRAKQKIYLRSEFTSIVQAMSGLPFIRIDENAALTFAENSKRFNVETLYKLKTQNIMENSSLEIIPTDIDMQQVGGMDTFKKWIEKRKGAFSQEAKKFGIESPKGALLLGNPGNGKSLMAKAVASSWNLPLVKLDVGKLFSQTIGSSEQNVRNVLRTLDALAPVVVLIDEIEKGLSGVKSSNFSDSGTTARVVGTLLSWMQDKTSEVFIVATANDVTALPPELLRKGRFDEIFFCSLPEKEERDQIFRIHLEKRNQKVDNLKLDIAAEETGGYSGAEIEQVVKTSMLQAFNDGKDGVEQTHLLEAIKNTIPLFKTFKDELQALIDWVDWDVERQEGIKAIYASSALKTKRLEEKKKKTKTNDDVIDLRKDKTT
jgi:SpoVK/Ycf46/Vps4 family AAA+-type ATPase